MANTFDTEYGVSPWASLDRHTHDTYVPELLANFARRSVFYKMVDYAVNLAQARTKKIIFTQLIQPEPNIAPLDVRALWLPQLYVDSRSIEITTLRYGDKIQLHEYDDWITQWKQNGKAGLRNIMDNLLGPHMVESLDKLARNAYLSSYFKTFSGSVSGFNALTSTQSFEEAISRNVMFSAEMSDLEQNPVFCITSPAATYTLKSQTLGTGEWITRHQYTGQTALVNYEMGSYEGVRFVTHRDLTLWNCGAIVKQATVDAAISAGDGAPDPETTMVDGVWRVGQEGATHGVTYTDVTGTLAVDDYVTLHNARNATEDATHVQDGVVWDNAYNIERRIVAVSGGKVFFDKPVMNDDFETDLGSGVYGYMTVAKPVHAALFIKGPRSVVCGVTMPPRTHQPPAVDDTESIHRFSWDAYLRYTQWYTDRFQVYFYSGTVAIPNTTLLVTL